MYSHRTSVARRNRYFTSMNGEMALSRENRGLTASDLRKSLTKKNLLEWLPGFPIRSWLPKYSMFDLQSDITAGLTVGLMVVPQAIAYAGIAGLPHEYGLYSSFMGCIAYFFVGSAKDVTLGPTAIMSLMVNSVADPVQFGAGYAIALTLVCGVIQLAMSMFRLGALMSFISAPVISGFTSAAAITIAMGQVKHIFGIKQHVPRPFIKCVNGTFSEVFHGDVRGGDIAMGVTCMLVAIGLKQFKTVVTDWDKQDKDPAAVPRRVRVSRKLLWFVTTGRNALIVTVAALIAYALQSQNKDYLTLTGKMKSGFPPVGVPELHSTAPVNSTNLRPCTTCANANHSGIGDIMTDFGVGAISVPLIGLLELVAIAQAFARQNNYVIDPNQELFAIGIANIISAFFCSYPVTGSFSRTAVNAASGVRTPAAGLVTASVVLLAIGVATPLFRFIPVAALSAIIITAVLGMVNIKILVTLWKVKPTDLIPLIVAFAGTLFLGIEYGVILAVVVNVFYILYLQARPHFTWRATGDIVVLRVHGGLDFPSISYLRQILRGIEEEMANETMALSTVIFDWTCVMDVDYTVVLTLQDLNDELKRKDVSLVHVALEPPVEKVLLAGIPHFQSYATVEEAHSRMHVVNLTSDFHHETDRLLKSGATASTGGDDGL